MAATTVLKTAIPGGPQASIANPHHNSFPKLLSFRMSTRKPTCPRSHFISIKFNYAKFYPEVVKRHRFGLGSVGFASSGESVETQEVEDEVFDSQLQVHWLNTQELYICLYISGSLRFIMILMIFFWVSMIVHWEG